MWNDRIIESYTKRRIEEDRPEEAEELWGRYVLTRKELVENILPRIAANEPNLTDHGENHIANVLDNAGKILGLETSGGQPPEKLPVSLLGSADLLLLLLGCLLHDIGNIVDRKIHNIVTTEVWQKAGTSYQLWSANDRRVAVAVCRAHTGTAPDGSEDTLSPLTVDRKYFTNRNINASEIAAIIRFADELAEGRQRTSNYIIKNRLISTESEIYHQYAKCTNVQIDFTHRRIALTYDIDIADEFFQGRKVEKEQKLKHFLTLIYGRILKLEHERLFTRHYAPTYITFRETSVSIFFHNEDIPMNFSLRPLILNDFNGRGNKPEVLDKLDKTYKVAEVVKQVVTEGAGNAEQKSV